MTSAPGGEGGVAPKPKLYMEIYDMDDVIYFAIFCKSEDTEERGGNRWLNFLFNGQTGVTQGQAITFSHFFGQAWACAIGIPTIQ